MAELNIQHLQQVLSDATRNESLVREIRKAHGKVQTALDDLAQLLDPAYEPTERKKPVRKTDENKAGGTGRKPGRPKKTQDAQ